MRTQESFHGTNCAPGFLGTGRISEIRSAVETAFSSALEDLTTFQLVDALCVALQLDSEELDDLIANNSPVLRTVRGHAFEYYFDELLARSGIPSTTEGGDSDVDRIVNGYTLQLKTPNKAGTRDSQVQFKTHKTHGAKSEAESIDYYSSLDQFPDFLIGLVSYDPLRILVLHKDELPTLAVDPKKIQSPFNIDWSISPALNAFDRLEIGSINLAKFVENESDNLLPKTAAACGVTTRTIALTIFDQANFRIWDMSIRGFAREFNMRLELAAAEVEAVSPTPTMRPRYDKADLVIKLNGNSKFVQMKGISTNNCNFNLSDPLIACETQLTRGRVNDHPTQSRLYLHSDFDALVLALDPAITQLCKLSAGSTPILAWEHYVIPSDRLDRHHNFQNRYKSLQKWSYSELQEFKVRDWSTG